ncbi:supervillin-like isoform X2 [Ornithodoros turicata]|uniref:supervillin-like isoform X2 n=1 Tax=Ornithodoros turicata TaxID=34597 RepID=UPI0031389D88
MSVPHGKTSSRKGPSDVGNRMSKTEDAATEHLTAGADSESSSTAEGRAERIARYKRQRREELSSKYGGGASAAAPCASSAASNPKGDSSKEHVTVPERKSSIPNVRMTKAARLRALQISANAHAAMDPYSKVEHSSHRQPQPTSDRHGLKPLDVNDNVQTSKHTASRGGRVANGTANHGSVMDRGCKPKSSVNGVSTHAPMSSAVPSSGGSKEHLAAPRVKHFERNTPTRGSLPLPRRRSSDVSRRTPPPEVIKVSSASVNVQPPPLPDPPVGQHSEEPTTGPPVAVYTVTIHTTSTTFSQSTAESSSSPPEATSSTEQPVLKSEERRASFSETVHSILKARDDDSAADERKPRHSILKKTEERGTTPSGLHSILKRSGSEEGDPPVGVEVQSILKFKADDAPRPPSGPKPILKKHEESRESPVEPKPILKRKSVDVDGEGKPRPILKTQQRRWSQEHEPTPSDDIVVRRRSRSTELDAKPTLRFSNEPEGGLLQNLGGGGDCGRLPLPPQYRRPLPDAKTGGGDERKFAVESDESSSEEFKDLSKGDHVAAVNVELLKAVQGASCSSAKPSHVYNLDCQDTPQAISPLLRSDPDLHPSSIPVSKQISRLASEKKPVPSEAQNKSEEFVEQQTSTSHLFLQRLRHRTVPVTADEMSAASKRETTSQAEGAVATEDKLSKLSVADKVSLFKKTTTPEPTRTQKPRYAPAARRSNPRSLTQPVTTEEVEQAKREAEASAKEKEEGDSLSQMSLAEKLRMFNEKVTVDMLKQRPVSRLQSTKRATEESGEGAPPPARPRAQTSPTPEVSSKITEPSTASVAKGILKNPASPRLPIKGILKSDHTEHSEPKDDVKSILKPDHETGRVSPAKPILKAEQKDESSETSESSSSEEDSEEESGTSSESDSSDENEEVDTKKILAPGTKHLVVRSPVPQKKAISNPAVQRMLNASLRRKGEDERSVQVLSSETRLRSLSANASDMVETNKLYTRDTNQTQPITVDEWRTCSGGIAQRLESLRKSEDNWKGRLKKDELTAADVAASTPVSVLRKDAKIIEVKKSPSIGDRKTWLESSSETWRQRVQESDAVQFTVAGKMGCTEPSVKDLLLTERKKRAPKPDTFSSPQPEVLRRIQQQGTPILPLLLKSKSMPNAAAQELRFRIKAEVQDQPRVLIPKADNETFTSFFESVVPLSKQESHVEISESAFDEVKSTNVKLAQRKKVVMKRKQQTKGNPLRALASRTDLHQEYTEVRSDVAERELQRINVEKLAKTSDLAVSALAGLASTEDFRSVQLKKRDFTASGLLPNRDLALVQVKGRRHVQTRLVEPAVSSINHGDVFILVTPATIYLWIGQHSNVIERSKAADVAASIQAKKDLHFKGSSEVKVIDEEKGGNSADERTFFKLLGGTVEDCSPAGDPGDDLRFEAAIIDTNMVYVVEGEALVPCDKYWGMQPRFEMLQPDKAFVFNFGSELYVWLGKQVPHEQRVVAVRLAEERSREGFDYSECDINPLCPKVGVTTGSPRDTKDQDRPNWTLLAKVNQHMEPVLFREKFLDWPDDTKLIRVKKQAQEESKTAASESELKPYDAKILLQNKPDEPDLELSGSHLGRGLKYVDTVEQRNYEIATLGVKVWHTTEYEHRALPKTSYGQFHSGDTYVIRWQYMVTQTGRQLTGERSRHIPTGRERCAYFFWQGRGSTVTEQGACARLTVELDEERGPHVRVLEGKEPPCFLNLFKGKMVIHRGKREVPIPSSSNWRMYFVRGEVSHEAALVEVSTPGTQHLRSRASYVILHSKSNSEVDSIYLWHGACSAKHTREVADHASDELLEEWPEEMRLKLGSDPEIIELDEGTEPSEFWEGLGGDHKRKQHLFHSLLDSKLKYDFTPRLFHATAVSKTFEVQEVLCAWRRTDVPCAYPFLQSDLYDVQQPAVFFLDNKHEMYIWQGWWPQDLLDDGVTSASSEKVRWNTTRRLAMETALHYAQEANPSNPPTVYLVFAGLEPVEFTSLFPVWEDHDDIAQVLMKEGKSQGEKRSVQETLAELTKVHYSLEELKQDPLPEGVDPRRLEAYLSDDEFETVFECSKNKFYELPVWKQNKQKEQVGLF